MTTLVAGKQKSKKNGTYTVVLKVEQVNDLGFITYDYGCIKVNRQIKEGTRFTCSSFKIQTNENGYRWFKEIHNMEQI